MPKLQTSARDKEKSHYFKSLSSSAEKRHPGERNGVSYVPGVAYLAHGGGHAPLQDELEQVVEHELGETTSTAMFKGEGESEEQENEEEK